MWYRCCHDIYSKVFSSLFSHVSFIYVTIMNVLAYGFFYMHKDLLRFFVTCGNLLFSMDLMLFRLRIFYGLDAYKDRLLLSFWYIYKDGDFFYGLEECKDGSSSAVLIHIRTELICCFGLHNKYHMLLWTIWYIQDGLFQWFSYIQDKAFPVLIHYR